MKNSNPDCPACRPPRGFFAVKVADRVIVSSGPEARPYPQLRRIDLGSVIASAIAAVEEEQSTP